MQIKHAGPRALITHHGISIMKHHPDKYIYFQRVFNLFKLIKEAPKRSHFVYKKRTTDATDSDIADWISSRYPDIEEIVDKELMQYKEKLSQEIDDITANTTLSELDKNAWLGNLKQMHNYRILRAQNKILYWHMIDTISDIIIEKDITEFVFDYTIEMYHIIEAIGNHLRAHKQLLNVNILVKECDDDVTFIYLILHDRTFITC